MNILGGGKKIIGIDTFVPDDLKERIASHGKLSEMIEWIVGSSVEYNTIDKIKKIVGNSRNVMIILDSYHTHDHVLKELRLYSPFVGKGYYLICCDTIVEYIPVQKHRSRPWGPENNPKTALNVFLRENDRFKVDKDLENKLLLTCNPSGYLEAIKD
jgi:cephalosporin hydroxylase